MGERGGETELARSSARSIRTCTWRKSPPVTARRPRTGTAISTSPSSTAMSACIRASISTPNWLVRPLGIPRTSSRAGRSSGSGIRS